MKVSRMEVIANSAGTYSTGTRARPWARNFPSLIFYSRFLQLVFRASALAKRGQFTDEEWASGSLSVLRALEKVGVHVEITGYQNLYAVRGASVLVSNHMSTLETIVLPGIVQPVKDVTFVVKRGIVEYPVFKHIIRARDPIVVDRKSPRADLITVLTQGEKLLYAGRSVIVFPQTTRTHHFDPSQFNTIGIKLAKRAGVPVIPVAVRSDAWGNGRIVREFGKIDPSKPVRISFGSPLDVEGRGNEQHADVISFIEDCLRRWQNARE